MRAFLVILTAVGVVDGFVAPSSGLASGRHARLPACQGSTNMRMAATASGDSQFAVADAIESDVAPKGGGFWFGSAGFWGEETYRGFVDSYKPNSLINGVYPIVERVRATKVLTTTSESGLLSELEDAGLTLSETEKLLPALEEAGLLSFVADNGDVLINLFGFLAVEPAKLAIPVVVSLVKALKGAGVLKLAGGEAAPAVETPPVKVSTQRPSAVVAPAPKPKVAPAPKAKVAPAPRPKFVAASKPKVAPAPKPKVAPAPKKPAPAPKPKVAPKAQRPLAVVAPAPKKPAPAPKPKAAPKPVARAPSAPRGNISNLPKAL